MSQEEFTAETFLSLPIARPSPPRNCTAKKVVEKNDAFLTVRCIPGYDGGLNQHFTLEAVGDSGRILDNSTASRTGEKIL